MAFFQSGTGEIECRPVNMKAIRQEVETWEADNPAPAVPLVPVPTFEAQMSGREFDMLPNSQDEGYKAKLGTWSWKRYQFMEAKIMSRGVMGLDDPTTYTRLALVLITEERLSLFRFIVGLSEVTQEAVNEAAKRFRLYMARQTVTRLAY